MTENNSTKHVLDISKEYAIYVAENRAIPRVNDGLKHGQRVALWVLRKKAEKIKTMALTGVLMAEKLYVHGDASCNSTIGMLAAPYKNNVPLIKGHGQFGSRTMPGEIGAPRYTDVQRSPAAEAILYKDTDLVPLKDNYDGSNQEPMHFLPLVPVVLLNGVKGIALGWSCDILPRSLDGLIKATQDALSGAKKIRGLEPFYNLYDVTTKSTGENQWEFSGKVILEDASTVRIIALPPGIDIEDFRKKLIQLEESESILNFVDRSTDNINIEVKFKRGSVKDWTEEQAIDFLKLREKVTERIVTIDWDGKRIRTFSNPEDLVREFVEWRLAWYTTRYEKMLADTISERTYWKILKVLFDAGFTKKLGTFADKKSMSEEITKIVAKAKLDLTEEHLDRVLSLPTYRWTKDFEGDVLTKIAGYDTDIDDFTTILGSPEMLKAVYTMELDELKKLKIA